MEKYGTQEHMGKSTKGVASWGESAGRGTTSRAGGSRQGQERARDAQGRFVSATKSSSAKASSPNKTWGESSGRGYGSYK